MNVPSPKIDELARRLASVAGEDVETAVERAIEERLARMAQPERAGRNSVLAVFFDRLANMPIRDARPIEEIVGYGPDGLPL
jgi:antitoxin VapB